MRQFDICLLDGLPVVVLQHDFLDRLRTVVVAPLATAERFPAAHRLRPITTFQGEERVIAVERLAAVERHRLSPPLSSLEAQRDEIIAALDILVTGI